MMEDKNLLDARFSWPSVEPYWYISSIYCTNVVWWLEVQVVYPLFEKNYSKMQRSLGEFARLFKQITEDYGMVRPLLIALAEDDDDIKKRLEGEWRKWSQDVLWHRGEFFLIEPFSESEKNTNIREQWLHPVGSGIVLDKSINPTKLDSIIQKISQKIKNQDATKEVGEKTKWREEWPDEMALHLKSDKSVQQCREELVRWVKGKLSANILELCPDIKLPVNGDEDDDVSYQDEQIGPCTLSAEGAKESGYIARITNFSCQRALGIGDVQEIDLNADLVLITGANGVGKSSLLELLGILLTGDSKIIGVRELRSKVGKKNGVKTCAQITYQKKNVAMRGRQKNNMEHEGTETLGFECDGKENRWKGYYPSVGHLKSHNRSDTDARELLARLTFFHPERVVNLFDEWAEGATLQEIYNPAIRPLEKRRKVLRSLAKYLKDCEDILKTADDKELEEKREGLLSSLTQISKAIKPFIQEMSDVWPGNKGKWPGAPEIDDFSHWIEWVIECIQSWYGVKKEKDDEDLMDRFMALLIEFWEFYKKHAPEDSEVAQEKARLEDKLKAIKLKIEDIDKEHPQLEEWWRLFYGPSEEGIGLYYLIEALSRRKQQWLNEFKVIKENDPSLQDVYDELRRVDDELAGRSRELIEHQLGWLKETRDERARLEKERKRIEAKLKAIKKHRSYGFSYEQMIEEYGAHLKKGWDEYLKIYKKSSKKRKISANELDILGRLVELVERFHDAVEESLRPNEEIRKETKHIFNEILSRFSLVPGLMPVEFKIDEKGRWRLQCNNGLNIKDLSTGQKSQFALALLVAQHMIARELMPHQVLLLDDFSTSYDVNNLLREAILLRQLAYSSDDTLKRQIFVSSHFEETTNQFLYLLQPPKGFRMLMIELKGRGEEGITKMDVYEVPSMEDESSDITVMIEELKSAVKVERSMK